MLQETFHLPFTQLFYPVKLFARFSKKNRHDKLVFQFHNNILYCLIIPETRESPIFKPNQSLCMILELLKRIMLLGSYGV